MKSIPKGVFENPVILSLLPAYREICSLHYFEFLAGWDTETYMPAKGIEARGIALADLNAKVQEIYLRPEFLEAVAKFDELEELNDYEKGFVRIIKMQTKAFTKLPREFLQEFTELTSKTSTYWAQARKDENPAKFLPYLEKIFTLVKREAEYLGYETEPYDAIFEKYESGFTTKDLESYFAEMKSFLKTIDLKDRKFATKNILIQEKYEHTAARDLNHKILETFGWETDRMRLDVSSHPFSLFLSKDDVRLTTRYPEYDITSSVLSTIHEFGHGLFASQIDERLANSPMWLDVSYALHESQSRFWENMLGRSHGFAKTFVGEFKNAYLQDIGINADSLWQSFNHIQPSLIRVEADEITYHWHIIIRFEIERAVLNGELEVKDIPQAWDNKYEEYLGVRPEKPSQGFLQDIHWSFGSIGYFPTYSLGSVTSAIWLELMNKKFDLDTELTQAKMLEINAWFLENIHQYGGTYSLKEIVKKVAGIEFSAKPWIKYIKNKYGLA